MIKILKIRVSGFKILEDDFTLNLLSKSKATTSDKEDELISLKENLYMPTTTVFTGKNSSGKSTMLSLFEFVDELLYNGRIRYKALDFRESSIQLELMFLLDNHVYKYNGTIIKPDGNMLDKEQYCHFADEHISEKKYYKSYGKHIIDADFDPVDEYDSNVADTSALYKLTSNKHLMINSTFWIDKMKISKVFELFDKFEVSDDLLLQITNLFDDSIRIFNFDKEKKLYTLALSSLDSRTYSETEIETVLSDGTKKGLIIFALSIAMLKYGGTLIIDEIENSLHKNLVENIIMIFNDKRINKNKANLIFSTHYIEILDIFRRRDNIYIMDKNEYITNRNLHKDYETRTDLLKSNQFNNNTFKTLINYDQLMTLKKSLMNEIPNSLRGQ